MDGNPAVSVVYFSGTGGTARIAACLADAFTTLGAQCALTELGAGRETAPEAELLVLAYPVYAANAPQPIGEWIAAAPEGAGRRAAVISVSGGGEVSPNTGCRTATIRALQARGYQVAYEAMAVMPSNFGVAYSDALAATLLRRAPVFAARVARELLAGQTRRLRPHGIDRALSFVLLVEHMGSGRFGRSLRAGDACNGCGLCARRCPRGNIQMRQAQPAFGDRCVLCLRCVYGCPQRAIKPGFGRAVILKGGFDLSALEARTVGQAAFPADDELTRGSLLHGVRHYLRETRE